MPQLPAHPFAAVENTQRLSANTATAAGTRVQPQVLPADVSTEQRTNSHSTTSSRMARTVIRMGWMYSQDRMRGALDARAG